MRVVLPAHQPAPSGLFGVRWYRVDRLTPDRSTTSALSSMASPRLILAWERPEVCSRRLVSVPEPHLLHELQQSFEEPPSALQRPVKLIEDARNLPKLAIKLPEERLAIFAGRRIEAGRRVRDRYKEPEQRGCSRDGVNEGCAPLLNGPAHFASPPAVEPRTWQCTSDSLTWR